MEDKELVGKIKRYKDDRKLNLCDLSFILDVNMAIIYDWFKTGKIKKIHAKGVKEKLGL